PSDGCQTCREMTRGTAPADGHELARERPHDRALTPAGQALPRLHLAGILELPVPPALGEDSVGLGRWFEGALAADSRTSAGRMPTLSPAPRSDTSTHTGASATHLKGHT